MPQSARADGPWQPDSEGFSMWPWQLAPTEFTGGQRARLEEGKGWLALAALALLTGGILFPNLSYPLIDPDEGRYAEIAREMLTSGDWVVPTKNHRPHLNKPPLIYWLVASSFQLFGTTEASARLVPTMAAFLTVLAIYGFAVRTLGRRAALVTSTVLALTPGLLQCGRFLVTDSLFTLLVACSLFASYLAIETERLRWQWWLASAVACGLGVLAKGPVALVLVVPPVVLYTWLTAGTGRPRIRHWAAFAIVASAVAVPWYVAVMVRHPAFVDQFIVGQNLARFRGRGYHDQPFWFYIPVLIVGCLPWSLLVGPLVVFFLSRAPAIRSSRSRPMGFALLWMGWCVGFFSASGGKLPTYILPAAPAVALVVGAYLDLALFHPSGSFFYWARVIVPRLAAFVLLMIWFVGSLFAWRLGLLGPSAAAVHSLLAGVGLVMALIGGSRMSPQTAWLVCAALTTGLMVEVLHDVTPAWAMRRSPLGRSPDVVQLVRHDRVPIACFGGEWGSIPFYLDSAEVIPGFFVEQPQAMWAFLDAHSRCLVVLKHRKYLEPFHAGAGRHRHITPIVDTGSSWILLVENGAR